MDQLKIGKFIAKLRKEKNLTQQTLGDKLGVTNKTVSRWENGIYMPDIETLQLLGKEFGVSINELISGERISEDEFKVKAEENIISIMTKDGSFSLKEKIHFFKKKWIREHVALIILSLILISISSVLAILKRSTLIIGCTPLLAGICYIFIYNRMMIYVEKNAFY